MSADTRKRQFAIPDGRPTKLGHEAAEGAAIGGSLGAVAAAIAAVGTTLCVPGLGLVIAGPLAAAIAGAGAGQATDGIVGALIGWGIPDERIKEYDQDLRKGGILMAVRPKSDEDASYFENARKANHGEHVYR